MLSFRKPPTLQGELSEFTCTCEPSVRIVVGGLYRKDIIRYAEGRIKVVKLDDNKVTKENVTGIISSINPKFVFFNGHGDARTITGHNFEPLIVENGNEDILKSRIVFALTCGAAASLGHSAVNKGALTFIGFKEDYVFLTDGNKSAKPLEDDLAKPFFETTNMIASSIASGHQTADAFEKAIGNYRKWIEYYRTNGHLPEAIILPYLSHDIEILELIGSEDASIND